MSLETTVAISSRFRGWSGSSSSKRPRSQWGNSRRGLDQVFVIDDGADRQVLVDASLGIDQQYGQLWSGQTLSSPPPLGQHFGERKTFQLSVED